MTRDEFEATLKQARKFGGYGLDQFFESLLAHDAEQRQTIEQQAQQIKQLQQELETTERALQRKRYRKECNIPACNCGPQWTHGGHAEQRLSEISDVVPYINGTTLRGRVEKLMQQADWDKVMEMTDRLLKEHP